jgi:thiamine kinase-like enzyme
MIECCPLQALIDNFAVDTEVLTITPFGRGHINNTYRVETKNGPNYLLQKINQHVFQDVAGLMHNFSVVTRHTQQQLLREKHPQPESAGLTLIQATNGTSYVIDENNDAWRLLRFIDNSRTYELVTDPKLAEEGAFAFGEFQRHIAGIDPNQLTITIPNFHHLPTRLTQFERAIQADNQQRARHVKTEVDYVRNAQYAMCTTQRLLDAGEIPVRITHNDTKMNNILFSQTGDALCVIDLDTVMPGVFQFDFSDTVRTMANTATEDENNLSLVALNPDLFTAIATGYLRATRHILTAQEINLLVPAAHLMPFIIGLRFLTDYLQGDVYFKTDHPQQNLDRARCQFRLAQDIEIRQSQLKQIINALVKNT